MGTATKPNPLPATFSGRVPVSIHISISGTGAEEVLSWQNNLGHKVKVREAKFVPIDAVTGDDTNNFALSVVNKGTGGAGTTVVVPVKTYATGVDMVAFKSDDLPVSTVEADLGVAVDEVLALDKTVNGTGLALPEGKLVLEVEYD